MAESHVRHPPAPRRAHPGAQGALIALSRRRFSVVPVALALVAAACSSGGGHKQAAARPSTTPAPTTTTVPPVFPLTGLPATDPARMNRPALVVKIENVPEARPQSGIEYADLVYEEVVEAG